MKVSIITPTYNSGSTIKRTIESIISQNFKNIEYVVVDNLSSDNTLEVVREYINKIDIKIISEKDNGIYDAMNKGINLCSGDIISILNSDDFYSDNSVISDVTHIFEDEDVLGVYGDISYFGSDVNKITRIWKAGIYKEKKLNNGWIIPHPSLFLRGSVYKECGLFNTDFKIASDYEFILRILKINKIKVKYLPRTLVKMFNGGYSGQFSSRKIRWMEIKKAWKINNFKFPRFLIIKRMFSRVMQITRL